MSLYELPELEYDYAALEPHYGARTLELHHSKHHKAYVDGANATLEKLEQARDDDAFSTINALQKDLAFHVSGHVLHSIFWKNMSPDGGGAPEGELGAAIADGFGSFERLKRQLGEAAAKVQGSGWGTLSWEPLGKRLVVEQIYDHQGNVGNGSVPILVIDVWEHAYYLEHQNRRADWIECFWKVAHWQDAAHRFESVRGIDLLAG